MEEVEKPKPVTLVRTAATPGRYAGKEFRQGSRVDFPAGVAEQLVATKEWDYVVQASAAATDEVIAPESTLAPQPSPKKRAAKPIKNK